MPEQPEWPEYRERRVTLEKFCDLLLEVRNFASSTLAHGLVQTLDRPDVRDKDPLEDLRARVAHRRGRARRDAQIRVS
jgi:hypothetical protein